MVCKNFLMKELIFIFFPVDEMRINGLGMILLELFCKSDVVLFSETKG